MTRAERHAYQNATAKLWIAREDAKELIRTLQVGHPDRRYQQGRMDAISDVLMALAKLWPDLDDEPPDL
jgi:hypothetical protein